MRFAFDVAQANDRCFRNARGLGRAVFLLVFRAFPGAFARLGRTAPRAAHQLSLGERQIRQTKQILDDMERMLDPCLDLGLGRSTAISSSLTAPSPSP